MTYKLENPVDLAGFTSLTFSYKIKTNKKTEGKKDFMVNFYSSQAKVDYHIDLNKEDGQWHKMTIPIKDVIQQSKKDATAWADLQGIQIGIAENRYKDGTTLDVKFKNIVLK